MRFPSKASTFMRELQRNNDRDWFKANKPRYDEALEEVKAFAKTVGEGLAASDELEPKRNHGLTRIYRDTRFSKDKTPYKRYWGGGFSREGKQRRGGYYWHVEPGGLETWGEFDKSQEAFVGGGFWAPERDDLARIREELASDHEHFRRMLRETSVANSFTGLHEGEKLKTAPKGYDKDHPAIDLLNHKSFVLVRHFSKQEVAKPDFSAQVVKTFEDMRPFLDYMTQVLTTDSNGVPLS